MAFKGKPPGGGAGEISKRTEALRPAVTLNVRQISEARQRRRAGETAEMIAAAMGKPVEEVEKVLLQMRMPRPETTRGTLNVTLAAHRLIMSERHGDEPIWVTMDRLLDELLRLRQMQAGEEKSLPRRTPMRRREVSESLPLLAALDARQT
jgi:hypothetical protein